MMRLLIFDYDMTLAFPASEVPTDILYEIDRLLCSNYVAIISGGRTLGQLLDLLVSHLPIESNSFLGNLYLCPSYGNMIYSLNDGPQLIYKAENMRIEDKKYILDIINQIEWKNFDIPDVKGQQINDRGSFISINCLGKDASREIKEIWDPEKVRRRKIKKELDRVFKGRFDVFASGRTTIDIVSDGNRKVDNTKRLAKMLNISLRDVVFTGDEFEPYGNDFPILELEDVTVNITTGPEETLKYMRLML